MVTGLRRSLPAGSSTVCSSCPGCGLDLELRLHADSKVAPSAVWDSSARATFANAFPLPAGPLEQGGSCSGFSSGLEFDGDAAGSCSACYAAGLEGYSPGFRDMARANLEAVRHVLDCGGARALGLVFADMLEHVGSWWARVGLEGPVSFRWQSDGDILNAAHARAIVSAHRIARGRGLDLVGWVYTRTLGAARILATGERHGLRSIVSVDRVNVERAAAVAGRYRLPIAVLGRDSLEVDSLEARAHQIAGPGRIPAARLCPAAGGRWSHDDYGPAHIVAPSRRRADLERGAVAIGACHACRLCVDSSARLSVGFVHHGGSRVTVRPVSIGARS